MRAALRAILPAVVFASATIGLIRSSTAQDPPAVDGKNWGEYRLVLEDNELEWSLYNNNDQLSNAVEDGDKINSVEWVDPETREVVKVTVDRWILPARGAVLDKSILYIKTNVMTVSTIYSIGTLYRYGMNGPVVCRADKCNDDWVWLDWHPSVKPPGVTDVKAGSLVGVIVGQPEQEPFDLTPYVLGALIVLSAGTMLALMRRMQARLEKIDKKLDELVPKDDDEDDDKDGE